MADFMPHEAPAKDIKELPVMHPGRPVGRDDLIKTIYGHLRDNDAVLLHGKPGIGKTTLAAALAAAYTQQPGGVLWVNSRADTLAALLVHIGRAYKLNEVTNSEDPTAHVGMIANVIMQRKPFLVLDGVRDAGVATQFVEKCASNRPMLLISDDPLQGAWANVALPPLDDTAALALYKQKSGVSDDSQDSSIYGIVKLLQHEPYPIVIAARAMAASKEAPDAYFNKLKQLMQSVGGNGPIAALTASYRALNNALQGLMLMLGASFDGEASLELLSMVSGAPTTSIQQATTVLSQLYLIEKFERYGKPYYRMHPFVYQFAQTWLKGSNRLQPLQNKMREATLAYAKKHSAEGNHDALALEMNTFISTARHDAQQGERNTANALVVALTQTSDFLQTRGYLYELLQLRDLSTGDTAAFPAHGPEVARDAPFGFDEGDGATDKDDYDYIDEDALEDAPPEDAEPNRMTIPGFDEGVDSSSISTDALKTIDIDQLRTALAQARQQGDTPRQLQILKAIGKVQVGQQKETEAIATYTELLNAFEEEADDASVLETLDMLAGLLVRTGNHQAAVMHATSGIQLAQRLSDDTTEMHLQMTLGDARQELGESQAAVDVLERALEIARTQDDRQNEAIILYKLGYAQLDNGETDTAIETWNQARELFKENNHRNYEGKVLSGLGAAYGEMGRWSEAMRFYKSALYIAREVQDGAEERQQLSHLGQAQIEAGELKDALISYRQALHAAYQQGTDDVIVSSVVDLVGLMIRSDKLLAIANMLIDDALDHKPNDRDATDLKQQISQRVSAAASRGIHQKPISGSPQQYAANAYALLEA